MPDLSDEQEIFASTETADEIQPAAEVLEAPAATVEAPIAEVAPPNPADPREGEQGHVPYAALKEERNARKALQAQVEELKTLMLRGQQQPPKAPQEPETPIELWDDPNKFIDSRTAPILDSVQETREYFSRQLAETRHGAEKVDAAYAALDAAISKGELNKDQVLSSLKKSPDPYRDIMDWHSKYSVISEVGSDPKAYEDRIRAKILAELQAEAPAGQDPAGASASQRPGTPLPSLNRSHGNAGNVLGGAITEEDIFNAAPAFGKPRKA